MPASRRGVGDRAGQRMGAALRQRVPRAHRRLGGQVGGVGQDRPAGGQRAGLVEDDGVDLGEPLERLAVLEKHAVAEQPARGGGQHGRAPRGRARRGR